MDGIGWKTTITKAGLETLAKQKEVFVAAAKAGTGLVNEDEMAVQTDLLEAKQQMLIIEDHAEGNQRTFRLQLMNKEVSATYTLNQLGIYASVNGGKPLLYFIAQNDYGDIVPSNSTVSGFVAEYVLTLVFSENAEVTFQTVEGTFITPNALEAKLDQVYSQLNMVEITAEEIISMYGGGIGTGGIGDIGDAEIGIAPGEIDEMYSNDVAYSVDTGIPNGEIDGMYNN